MCNYEVDLIPNSYCLYQNTPICLFSVKFLAGDEDNSEKKIELVSNVYVYLNRQKDDKEREKRQLETCEWPI